MDAPVVRVFSTYEEAIADGCPRQLRKAWIEAIWLADLDAATWPNGDPPAFTSEGTYR
jgi:hypothetical protein